MSTHMVTGSALIWLSLSVSPSSPDTYELFQNLWNVDCFQAAMSEIPAEPTKSVIESKLKPGRREEKQRNEVLESNLLPDCKWQEMKRKV